MRVRVPPSSLAITYYGASYSDGVSFPVVAGNNHSFSCTTPGVKPATKFTWILSAGITSDQPLGSQTETPNSDDSRLTDSTNTITVNIAKTPANAQLTCGATNRQDGSNIADMSITVTLQVRVPPTKVKLSDSNGDKAPGEVVNVTEGTPYPMTCLVQGTRPAATIQWFMDNVAPSTGVETLTESSSNGLIDTAGTWTFTPVRANHRQVVKCVANTLESQQPYPSAEITLNVYGPPDNPMITSSTPMMEGAETRLICTADKGYPNNWQLEWSNGTMGFDSTNTTYQDSLTFSDRYLFTSNLDITPSREDNGRTVINCSAEGGSWIPGREGSYGPIDVQFCARIVSAQCPVVTAGNTATLSCTSESSNPETNLTWYDKNNVELTSETPQVDPNGAYGGEVTTRRYTTAELSKTDNGEEFKCCATNIAITCASNLHVCDMCTLDVRYPPVLSQPTKTPTEPVVEGSNVTLACTVDANPRPSDITWKKQDSSEAFSSVYNEFNSTLTLSNIRREQAGYYMCQANNGVPTADPNDDVVSDSVTLIVHYEVNITNKANDKEEVNNGDNAVLTCVAVGNPQPVMEWYGPNTMGIISDMDEGKFLITNETSGGDGVLGFEVTSTLTIKAVDSLVDYGVYTCISSNGIGREDSLNITLNGTRRPDEPTGVVITERTAESLTVGWTPGFDGGEEQSFRVSYFKSSDPSKVVFTDEIPIGGKTTSTATGLDDYTEYEIRVYAKNAIGESIGYGNTTGYTLPNPPGPGSGITVGFNKKDGTVAVGGLKEGNGCIQLEVQYQGNGTWKECGACISSDQKVKLSEWCASSQKRRRRAAGDIEAVRSKKCFDDLCSEPAAAEIVKPTDATPLGLDIGLIVGATVGGIILIAIIVVLVVYLVRTSPQRKNGKEDSFSPAYYIQEVELQEPSHDVQPEENNGITNQALQNKDGLEADTTKGPIPVKRYTVDSGDTYAQVNKTKLPPKPQSARSAPTIYKDKKPKPPHDDYAAMKKPKKYVPPSSRAAEESAYEEIQISDKDKAKSPPAAAAEESAYEEVQISDKDKTKSPPAAAAEESAYEEIQISDKDKAKSPPAAAAEESAYEEVLISDKDKTKSPPAADDYTAMKKPKKYVPPSSRAAEESAYEEVPISDKDKAKSPPAAAAEESAYEEMQNSDKDKAKGPPAAAAEESGYEEMQNSDKDKAKGPPAAAAEESGYEEMQNSDKDKAKGPPAAAAEESGYEEMQNSDKDKAKGPPAAAAEESGYEEMQNSDKDKAKGPPAAAAEESGYEEMQNSDKDKAKGPPAAAAEESGYEEMQNSDKDKAKGPPAAAAEESGYEEMQNSDKDKAKGPPAAAAEESGYEEMQNSDKDKAKGPPAAAAEESAYEEMQISDKDKTKSPPAADDYTAMKKPKKYVPPSSRAAEESAYEEMQISDKDKAKSPPAAAAEESAYEEVPISDKDKTKSPPAADSADTYASVGGQQDTSGRVVTEDGLIYAEVGHMKQHPVDQPPIQTEESTEYASLDFARMKPEDK
ncbi:uncharacterized protein LOC119735735 isoform X5 [Patiria miniata]|uniref:Uncharacterized protein n=1 Tax=Patiria miniata TaxID=46514 RepID=A0A914APM6_PATMI|nr:uncharacterized protein LOC119735735 isoform X5 [Patiria miniata]